MSSKSYCIGSRKSDLAMWQAREVQSKLSQRFSASFPIQTEVSLGDNVLDKSLAALAASNPGVFTKELEAGLLGCVYTIAVHSLKDMPTNLPPGLSLVGISAREDPRDAVVLARRHTRAGGGSATGLADLPPGSIVGTSSVRREAMLRRAFPHLSIAGIRGNLNTRLKKLDAVPQLASADAEPSPAPQYYDAIVLATAGLVRMGWSDRVTEKLGVDDFPYGVSQGALGIEARTGDEDGSRFGRAMTHGPSALRCLAERAFLRKLQGGCTVPVAVASWYEDGEGKDGKEGAAAAAGGTAIASRDGQPERCRVLTINGTVLALDGSSIVSASVCESVMVPEPPHSTTASESQDHLSAAVLPTDGPLLSTLQWDTLCAEGERIGTALADRVLRGGAAELLAPLGLGLDRPLTYGSAEGLTGTQSE